MESALTEAVAHLKAGRLDEVEALCRPILARRPKDIVALQCMGIAALRAGRPDQAVSFLHQAADTKKGDVGLLTNLGAALKAAGRLEEAVAVYELAVTSAPGAGETLFNLGNALSAMGRQIEAEAAYRRAIAAGNCRDGGAGAMSNLGALLEGRGQFGEAAEIFGEVVRRRPDFGPYRYNLANALLARGALEEAIAEYGRAIALSPGYAEAHLNLGNALYRKGDLPAAFASFQQALALRPDFAEAQTAIGNVLMDQRRISEAIDAYRKVLALRPGDAAACNNLAIALRKTGEPHEALCALDEAIAQAPDAALSHLNRGTILVDLGRYEEALDATRKAFMLQPGLAGALTNFVRLLAELGRRQEAIATCQSAMEDDPARADAFSELARLRQEAGEVDAAHAACIKALALDPGLAQAHHYLGNVLRDQGRLDEAIRSYRAALDLTPDDEIIRSALAFTVQFASNYDAAAILRENRRWAELHETPLQSSIAVHTNDRRKDRPLRVGYVAPYFHRHVAAQFLLPVLSRHDSARVIVFCYSGVKFPDDVTQAFKDMNHSWRDVAGLADDALARQIRADEIDILVDIALHMEGSRLLTFARKPAPVQVTWLGYPGTTGLTSIDYRLSDPYLDPAGGSDAVYSERTIRLPNTFWCYTPLGPTPEVSGLPAQRTGELSFGCFNNFHKVTRETLLLWSRVLRAVPDARLTILSQPGSHRQAVQRLFEDAGVSAGRIRFIARVAPDDYWRLYDGIDLCLDTTPYPGHTTTLDSLWMGVPVVTLAGPTVVGRGGVSILSNMNLTSLIARTEDEYVDIAAAIARDIDALAGLRATLRERLRASPLMDATQFAADLEDAYARMWSDYCEAHRG